MVFLLTLSVAPTIFAVFILKSTTDFGDTTHHTPSNTKSNPQKLIHN